ncbi:hypothetical protein BG004_000287 [Podila humilis]|nr:hypothetical protein BG004_000287 [Podila humilis]
MWISALDIPHIIESIVEPLSKRDYAACCLVSHHWRDVFQPVLWQHLDFKRDINGDLHWREDAVNAEKAQQSQDLLAMVGKNGRSIQSLRLSTDVAVNAILLLSRTSYHLDQRQQLRDNITLSNLNRLHFGDKLPPGSCLESSLFLFQQSSSLKELQMDVLKVLTFAELVLFPTYLAALSQTKSLTSIHIMRTEFRCHLVEDLLMNLPLSIMELDLNLDGLHENSWYFSGGHIVVRTQPFWKKKRRNERKKDRNIPLQYAELSNKRSEWVEYPSLSKARMCFKTGTSDSEYLLSFLAICPALTCFTIDMPRYQHTELPQDMPLPPWPLVTLELCTSYHPRHKEFTPLLVKRCGQTLQHLILGVTSAFSSEEVQYLLCSLPCLESFSTEVDSDFSQLPEEWSRYRTWQYSTTIRASDIFRGMKEASFKGAWVCSRLKDLRLNIVDDCARLGLDSESVFKVVLQQVGAMTQLQPRNVRWWSGNTKQVDAWPYL